MLRSVSSLCIVAVLLVAATAASADVITLTNGDRITGEIVAVRDGKVVLDTTYGGQIEIDSALIATPGDGRVDVTTLEGTVEAAAAAVNSGKSRGELQAEIDRLAAPTSPWKGKLELGALWTDGNTDRLGGHAILTVVRDTPDDKLTGKASINYAEEDGVKIADEQILSLREDIKFDPWYVYFLLAFERDQFEDVDLRAVFSPGAGRNLVKNDTWIVDFEIGPSLTYNDYVSRDPAYSAELRIGFFASWNVFGEAKITEDLQIYPSLTEGGEYRFVSETAFEQPLGGSWFMKLSVIDRYNSDVVEGIEENDIEVRLSLAYNF